MPLIFWSPEVRGQQKQHSGRVSRKISRGDPHLHSSDRPLGAVLEPTSMGPGRNSEGRLLGIAQEYPQAASSLAEVRDLVCRVAEVNVSHPAVLVASELATNAIRHAHGPFKVRVQASPVVRIEVTDQSPELPPMPRADSSWRGGLGVTIVNQLAARWGTEIDDDTKTVWAEVNHHPPGGRESD